MPVTVLSGFLGAGKTTVLNQVLRNRDGLKVAVIVNDMSEINIDAALLKNGDAMLSRPEEKLIEMQNGCICCTLREDLHKEVSQLARSGRFDYLLIESTGVSEPMPVAETFHFTDDEGVSLSQWSRLDTCVTVVDAFNFLKDYKKSEELRSKALAVSEEDERTVTDLLVDQVEFADVLILNKTDLCPGDRLSELESILRNLNPRAKILRSEFGEISPHHILNTRLFDLDRAANDAGWMKVLRGEETPETQTYGISSFVYRRGRPFHPERLSRLFQHSWAEEFGILRSKGFLWIASRPEQMGIWSQAGAVASLEGVSEWPDSPATKTQELVLIGQKMDEREIRRFLDDCLLSDAEMLLGPRAWVKFPDPIPSWDLVQNKE